MTDLAELMMSGVVHKLVGHFMQCGWYDIKGVTYLTTLHNNSVPFPALTAPKGSFILLDPESPGYTKSDVQ